jgi:methylated-DNA-[protein]-cysteine S-methyltransferase
MYYRTIASPVGPLLLAGEGDALRYVLFVRGRERSRPRREWEPDRGSLNEAVKQLTAYFEGRLHRFDLPLAPRGTPFQRRVWQALCDIPYGVTASYGMIARKVGNSSARAVGLANGSNPIAIIIPCHRVIGSDGSLTGYGGGLPIKKALLDLERGERTLFSA